MDYQRYISKNGGRRHDRFYAIWVNMKSRCNNENLISFKRYGGRGIQVCSAWNKFENFYLDMHASYEQHKNEYSELDTTLERVDNNQGYSNSNCRWETRTNQARNRRSNTILLFQGVSKTLGEWASELGIKRTTLGMRLTHYGWSIDKALTHK